MLWNNLKSELQKMVYSRWILLTAIGNLLLISVLILTLAPLANETGILLWQSKLRQSFYLGQIGFVVITVLYFGQEYQRSALRTSLLTLPRRTTFLMIKGIALLIGTLLLFVVSFGISVLTLHFGLRVRIQAADIVLFLCKLLPCFFCTIELCFITAAITILSRSIIVSFSIPIALILGLGSLLLQYGRIMRYLPILSVMNYFLPFVSSGYLLPIKGMLCQSGWCIVLVFFAWRVFLGRHVR